MEGQVIAHYRVLRKLGGGGMGVVYEAEDTKLSRRVALKFLPVETDHDPAAIERFLREARAASALNHPGICTIHAIEEHDDRSFIAMELLEGRSLDKLLSAAPLPISRVIEIGMQLADALDAAHKKGIVHRDIKPANIFVTDRGAIKILDFGLAKLLQEAGENLGGETIGDTAHVLTSPGTAVGTIAYMSPEQARGEELDGRSDLFSTGAVLYQAVTGKHPFPGSTSAVIFDNILHSAPVAPVSLNAEVPAELERILNKALEKDRDVRYQVAGELRADLKRLQRETDSGRTAVQSSGKNAVAATAGVTSGATQSAASSSSVIVEAARKHKLRTGLTLSLVAMLIAAAAFGVYSLVPRSHRLPFERFSIEKLTNNGHVSLAALSPDGKYLLHVRDEHGLQSLWLRHIPSGSNTEVVPPTATRYAGLTFSPDASYIYCVRRDDAEHTLASLYRAPVLGGTPQLLIKDVDSPITFSPDGQRFAYLRQHHDTPFWDLLIAHSDGTPDRSLFSNAPLESDSHVPAWSPDGKTITIPVSQPSPSTLGGLLAVDVANGRREVVATSDERILYAPAWMPDSRGLVLPTSTVQNGLTNRQITFLSYPSGELRDLTNDTNSYTWLSLASDGRAVAAIQGQFRFELSVSASQSPDSLRDVPLASRQTIWGWDWVPDGRLVIPQGSDIRIVKPDGGENVILSDSKHPADQAVSCGSNYVVYRQLGKAAKTAENLWRIESNGSNPRQLTFGQNEAGIECSADGRWVYYVDVADKQFLKRVPIEGGNPVTVFASPVSSYSLAPDGKTFATLDVSELDHKLMLQLTSIEDKKTAYHDIDQKAASWGFRFTPDGNSLVYIVREKGVDNLWVQPLVGGSYHPLTQFTSESIASFSFSRDGSQIAIERGRFESDAVLLRDTSK